MEMSEIPNKAKKIDIIKVRNFFSTETIHHITELFNRIPIWNLAVPDSNKALFNFPLDKTNNQRHQLIQATETHKTRNRFGYCYFFHSVKAFNTKATNDAITKSLAGFFEDRFFLKKLPASLELTSASVPEVNCTRFTSGDFLNLHSDHRPETPYCTRRYAFVLGLNRYWHHEWGGLTLFPPEFTEQTLPDIAQAVCPEYNSLLLFRVPKRHCVTQITPQAIESRNSISGWIHTG